MLMQECEVYIFIHRMLTLKMQRKGLCIQFGTLITKHNFLPRNANVLKIPISDMVN